MQELFHMIFFVRLGRYCPLVLSSVEKIVGIGRAPAGTAVAGRDGSA